MVKRWFLRTVAGLVVGSALLAACAAGAADDVNQLAASLNGIVLQGPGANASEKLISQAINGGSPGLVEVISIANSGKQLEIPERQQKMVQEAWCFNATYTTAVSLAMAGAQDPKINAGIVIVRLKSQFGGEPQLVFHSMTILRPPGKDVKTCDSVTIYDGLNTGAGP